MNSVTKKNPMGRNKEECRINSKKFMIAIVLSVTFGLGWGFGFITTSHDIQSVVIVFQAIFIIIVGLQGVLLFIFHGIRNPDVRDLWKSFFSAVSRKMRGVNTSSLTQSTGTSETNTCTPKQVSIPTSLEPSTNNMNSLMAVSENLTATAVTDIDANQYGLTQKQVSIPTSLEPYTDYMKSPSLIVSENSTASTVVDTNIDINQSCYGNMKHHKPEEVSTLKKKFYETGKQFSLKGCKPGFVSVTVKKFEELMQQERKVALRID